MLATVATEEAGNLKVGLAAQEEAVVSTVAVSAEAEQWEVSEEGLVSVAAAAVMALADYELVDMAEMVAVEAVSQEAAATELASAVCLVDQEVDMALEAVDTAVDDSVDAPQDWARWAERRLVHLAEWVEVIALEVALAVALKED